MHRAQQLSEDLRSLAAKQAGVLARGQLLTGGVSRRGIERLSATWPTVSAGVYQVNRLADEDPPWEARLWAGLLIAEAHARTNTTPGLPCIGGLAAAAHHGLVPHTTKTRHDTDRHAFTAAHDIDVFVPAGRRVRRDVEGYRFVRSAEASRATRSTGDLAVTGVEDTVLDVIELGTAAEAVEWVDRACQSRLTTPKSLIEVARSRTRLRHRRVVLSTLTDQVEGVTSELERIYRDEVEIPHGLPAARRQVRDGQQLLDNYYEGLVVELDGKIGHVGRGRHRDRRRDNRHVVRGRRSLRYGWFDCTHTPCEVAWEVGSLLVATGWGGFPEYCPNCPPDVGSLLLSTG